jgi:hypothetical protein
MVLWLKAPKPKVLLVFSAVARMLSPLDKYKAAAQRYTKTG